MLRMIEPRQAYFLEADSAYMLESCGYFSARAVSMFSGDVTGRGFLPNVAAIGQPFEALATTRWLPQVHI
jgi:hypothetical protein